MGKKVVMQGNIATAEAAIRAGCKFFAGYPITPQTTITEYLSWRMPEVDGQFVQAESEVAAINMIIGSSAGGARTMTATSGPGLSLMAEGMSVLVAGRMPSVIVDVQRSGAGGGGILASQSDYNFVTKSVGHGGQRAYVLGPSSVQELADLTYYAFDFADKYRTPVIIMSDGTTGQMMEPVELPEFKTEFPDKNDWIATGCKGRERRIVKEYNFDNNELEQRYIKNNEMYEKWAKEEVMLEEMMVEDAEIIIAAWGIGARVAKTTIKKLRAEGIKIGLIRPITLYPFPYETFNKLDPAKVKTVLAVEMSMPPLMYDDVRLGLEGRIPVHSFTRAGGITITPEEIEEAARKLL